MKKELWLEFGFLQENDYYDVCWYNEGRWQELPYFIKNLWCWRKRKGIYFLWRYGGRNHYVLRKLTNELTV